MVLLRASLSLRRKGGWDPKLEVGHAADGRGWWLVKAQEVPLEVEEGLPPVTSPQVREAPDVLQPTSVRSRGPLLAEERVQPPPGTSVRRKKQRRPFVLEDSLQAGLH